MSNQMGGDEQDPGAAALREMIGTMRPNDAPENETLRRISQLILQGMPTDKTPLRAGNAGSGQHILDRIMMARIHETIADGYLTSPPPPGAPHREGHTGALPHERTGRIVCVSIANDKTLIRFDEAVRDAELSVEWSDDPKARAREARHGREFAHPTIAHILENYGVDTADVHTILDPDSTLEFSYRGNHVRMSTLKGITNVTAWSDRLTAEEADELRIEHKMMLSQASPLAHIHQYLQRGEIPTTLQHLKTRIGEDRRDITAAFNEHAQQVRSHALSGGYRQFQIHSPYLRWGIPVAMHLLEQTPEETYDIIGDYSATDGSIAVTSPGAFQPIRNSETKWVVTENGTVAKATKI